MPGRERHTIGCALPAEGQGRTRETKTSLVGEDADKVQTLRPTLPSVGPCIELAGPAAMTRWKCAGAWVSRSSNSSRSAMSFVRPAQEWLDAIRVWDAAFLLWEG